MGETAQRTLTGEEADERTRPDTFVFCDECDDYLPRSEKPTHEHDLYPGSKAVRSGDLRDHEPDDEGEEDDEPEKLGAWYDITLSYSVDYRFRVPACTKQAAKCLAKDLKFDAKPADSHHVHTRRSKVDGIFEDDAGLPDDFDKFGGESLYDAIERAEEEP